VPVAHERIEWSRSSVTIITVTGYAAQASKRLGKPA